MIPSTCGLCRPELGPCLAKDRHWQLVLNHNQNFLGKCMWVLLRHLEIVPELSPEEWGELRDLLGSTRDVLNQMFEPDHYNFAFMQNQDRHVHMHVIPRYASSRTFEGLVFSDPDWPGHYTSLNPSFRPDSLVLERITDQFRQRWELTAAR